MVVKTQQKRIQKKSPAKSAPKPKTPAVIKKPEPVKVVSDEQKILDLHTRHLAKIDETLTALNKEFKEIKSAIVAVKTSQPVIQSSPAKKKIPDGSWHALIDPDREYTQKEIIGITKISQPTLSMAKVRGHIVTKDQPGKRGWVVLGSDLLNWDNARAKKGIKKSVNTPKSSKSAAVSKPVASKPVVSKSGKKASISRPSPKALAVPESSKTGKTIVVPKKETKALTVQSSSKTTKSGAAVKKVVKAPVTAKTTKSPKVQPAPKNETEMQVPIPGDIPNRISSLTLKKVVTQTQFGHDVGLSQKVIYEITTKKRKELTSPTIQKIEAALKKYESK